MKESESNHDYSLSLIMMTLFLSSWLLSFFNHDDSLSVIMSNLFHDERKRVIHAWTLFLSSWFLPFWKMSNLFLKKRFQIFHDEKKRVIMMIRIRFHHDERIESNFMMIRKGAISSWLQKECNHDEKKRAIMMKEREYSWWLEREFHHDYSLFFIMIFLFFHHE